MSVRCVPFAQAGHPQGRVDQDCRMLPCTTDEALSQCAGTQNEEKGPVQWILQKHVAFDPSIGAGCVIVYVLAVGNLQVLVHTGEMAIKSVDGKFQLVTNSDLAHSLEDDGLFEARSVFKILQRGAGESITKNSKRHAAGELEPHRHVDGTSCPDVVFF